MKEEKPQPKVVGKIDLSKFGKKQSNAIEEDSKKISMALSIVNVIE